MKTNISYHDLEKQVEYMYQMTRMYLKYYQDFYNHSNLMSILKAHRIRLELAQRIDFLAFNNHYFASRFSSPYVWDSVPLGSNRKGRLHLKRIQKNLNKVLDYALKKQEQERQKKQKSRIRNWGT